MSKFAIRVTFHATARWVLGIQLILNTSFQYVQCPKARSSVILKMFLICAEHYHVYVYTPKTM